MISTTERLPTPVAASTQRLLGRKLRANSGFLFILPAVILFLIFGLYTVIYSFALSFHRWNGFSQFSILPYVCQAPGCEFVGLRNFREFLYNDPTRSQFFWQALEHNFVLASGVPFGTILISLPLAAGLNRALRGQAIFRTLIMLPMITAGIAVYYVWNFIYQPNGILNTVLRGSGLNFLAARDGWLGQPDRALLALMIVMIWSAVPLATLLYLAGIQTIDKELYESAIIDGASSWQIIWKILWPLLYPITVIILITGINAALQGFEIVYLMTNGGPAGHTRVIGLEIFSYAFGGQSQDLGIASALSWMLFALTFVLALINVRIFRSRTLV